METEKCRNEVGNRIIRCGNDLDSLLFLDKDWGDLKKTSDPAGMKKTKIPLYLCRTRLEHTVHNVCTSKQKAATDLFLTGDFPTSSCSVVSLEVRPLFWGSWWIILTTHKLGFRLFLQSLHFLSVLRPHLWSVDFRMQKTIFFTELESISLC